MGREGSAVSYNEEGRARRLISVSRAFKFVNEARCPRRPARTRQLQPIRLEPDRRACGRDADLAYVRLPRGLFGALGGRSLFSPGSCYDNWSVGYFLGGFVYFFGWICIFFHMEWM